jgi:sarcosine oxidase subunit gamma
MPDIGTLSTRSAFDGLLTNQGNAERPGLSVEDRCGMGLATVIARSGQEQALRARIRERHGLELPDGPRRVTAGDVAFIGTGRGKWLATGTGDQGWVEDLARDLAGLAMVTDQSDGLAVLRIGGPCVRQALAKGVPIDLHPRAFTPDDAAVTAIGQIGVTLWQIDDAPTYEIAMFRSMAGSFWHWLASSAAEFGLTVSPRPAASPGRG